MFKYVSIENNVFFKLLLFPQSPLEGHLNSLLRKFDLKKNRTYVS